MALSRLGGVILLVAAATASAHGGGIAIVGGLSEERVTEPGQRYPGRIRLRNLGAAPRTARVYQTDYSFQADGTNLYGEPGKAPRSNARWITLGSSLVTVPPQGEASVNYTIEVPADRSLTGTYWSMVMVEGMEEGAAGDVAGAPAKVRVGVHQVLRYGIQIVTDLGETGTRSLRFDTQLVRAEGRRMLQVDVSNDGQRWLRPFLLLQLFDGEGRLIGKFDGERARVYPGTSVRRAIDLSRVPAGGYKALLVADAGEDNVYGATYTLPIER